MDTEQQSQQTQAGSEFEREPVPKNALLGFKSFIGMYAGEHCAGTELMIGPLFVAAGVNAFNLVMGLIVGNALAVLSWMFLCAPIATRRRLTLYYQLEKICGRRLVTLYNLANGVMFCFLAGAMVTVSATAVGVWFKFPMPALTDLLPNSIGWVVAVAVVGGLIAIVAAYGYKTVAKFANVASPWMVLVFLAFGFIGLRQFIIATNADIGSLGDTWQLAKEHIWKGGEPLPGQVKFTIWHVIFFAWFCNMAMHIGMSDLSVFRFAKKSWYAIATSAGMYVGHFMAWISASILYAYQLHLNPADTDVLPGPLAYRAAGLPGIVAEVFPLQSDADHRRDRNACRHVPGHRDEAARFRCYLRHDPYADGSGDLRGLLAYPKAGTEKLIRRTERPQLQLGRRSRVAAHTGHLSWCSLLDRTVVTVVRFPARLVRRRHLVYCIE